MKKVLLTILLLGIILLTGAAAATTYTDDLGRTVDLPDTISHIIPSGDMAQTTLTSFDSGYFVSRSMNFPKEAEKYFDERIPKLTNTGSLYGTKNTLLDEQLMRLARESDAELVLDIGENKTGIADDLNKMEKLTGIPFVHITQDTIDSIPTSYLSLGNLLGENQRGEELAAYTKSIIDRFRENMNKIGDKKATFIYVTVIDGNAVYMVGTGKKSAYHTQVLDIVGINVAPEATSGSGRGSEYTMEDILGLDPDIILVDANNAGEHEYYSAILTSPQWATLRAVQNGNVFENPVDVPWTWIGQPSSSFSKIISMIWLGSVFYPDVFTYDAKKEIQTFYKTVLNYDMTDTEVSDLTRYTLNKANKAAASTPVPFLGIIAGLTAVLFLVRKRS